MALQTNQDFGTVNLPTKKDIKLAKMSSKLLSQATNENDVVELHLPPLAFNLLVYALQEIAHGNALVVTSVHTEMTTQEAADMLNVSRPYLIKLLDEKKIPFHRVGTHRKIRYQDVVRYKEELKVVRNKAIDELIAESERLGLYD